MPIEKYRTHTTGLSDDELLILDVMFDSYVTWPMLRRRHFTNQFNAESHSLDDEHLVETLRRFVREDVIAPIEHTFRGHRYIGLTPAGGGLWSRERCPVWECYAMSRIRESTTDRELLTVRAATAQIRDDYLRLVPDGPARRRTAVIKDDSLIYWRAFGMIHVGLATYVPKTRWTPEEYQSQLAHRARCEAERTWWHTVAQMQRFMTRSAT